ncbi:tubulin/FtsZ family protein [Halosegnis marinus]|uniref:Tubulin-like protein CetZ n=1 Tax=Halosegnis marinus TaxID=3034023 RepID=A0ABD5ZR73_9EURY|nr:tubulin/FtsZ family protein [Halosegnis sp. DT85]
MKVALIGVGQAGGKLAESLASHDLARSSVTGTLAVNTARADLQPLHIDTLLVGEAQVNGHGVGGDNELGARVMDADATEVMEALSGRVTSECDAILLVAGLGGGTGSGGAPVLARELSEVYDIPVYALGVLPGRNEGALYQKNAGRSLKTLAREADSVILVDNDAWRAAGESMDEGFAAVNDRIAQRVGLLLAAGEYEGRDVAAESVVDSSEVINTLREGSLAAIGYASAASSEDAAENLNAVTSVARNALLTGTSLPDATEASSALLVVAGDPDRISRKGVESARSWLGEETGTMQVRGGDMPLDSDRLAALVLLGGVERSPRVREFFERAGAAAEEVERADATESLVSDDLDGLL